MFDSIDLEGLLRHAREMSMTPEALQALGGFVLFVVGFHAARLTYQAVRGPIGLGLWAVKFMGGSTIDLAKLAAWPVMSLARYYRGSESPLFAACKAALMSDRLLWEADDGENAAHVLIRDGDSSPFWANADGSYVCIGGNGVKFPSNREQKRIGKLIRQRAAELRRTEESTVRELLTEHLARAIAPPRPGLRGGTNKPSTRDELHHVAKAGNGWQYHG